MPGPLLSPLVFILSSLPSLQVFLSIKGIYYQAEVLGQPIVWIAPYAFSHDVSVPFGGALCWLGVGQVLSLESALAGFLILGRCAEVG